MANKLVLPLQSGTNNYLNPVAALTRMSTDTMTPGVVPIITNTSGTAPAGGSFGVNAQASPNMTVFVTGGSGSVAYVAATPTGGSMQMWAVTIDANENVTIASNSTGSTRWDFLYLQLDANKLNNPAVNGLDVASFITQRSTSQNYDSNGTPANALLLAIPQVVNNAVAINAGDVADRRRIASWNNDPGWEDANETWQPASATTITVPSGATNKYAVGDKIRLIQANATKYFYVIGVASTTLTITGGSDYTLTFAAPTTTDAIMNPTYSHVASPVGFPQWLNWTTTVTPATGAITSYTVNYSKFIITSRKVEFEADINIVTNGTGAGSVQMTIPINANRTTGGALYGRERVLTGNSLNGVLNGVNNAFSILYYNNAYPGANGNTLAVFGNYEI